MLSMKSKIFDYPIVALDTETSGGYPLTSEICEVAAVKYFKGEVIDEFQALVKISHKMPKHIEEIHGISDEMLKDATTFDTIAEDLFQFLDGSVMIGHHIQFDAGFLAIEFEKYLKKLPENLILCTSLLSRALISESPNHRLQTLISFLKLSQGQAHRALDDAKACLELFFKCTERVETDTLLQELEDVQETRYSWDDFSLDNFLETQVGINLVTYIKEEKLCFINYKSPNNKKDNYREVLPKGLVLSPKNAFLPAVCFKDMKEKRFYISRIQDVRLTNPYQA